MFKSTKKPLSMLLALMLILSVLPMAAFAAEEHVHDETCGCAPVLEVAAVSTCTHPSYERTGSMARYEAYSSTQHVYYSVSIRECNICGDTFYHDESWFLQDHDRANGIIYVGEEMNEEEVLYVYKCRCTCGEYYYVRSYTKLF